MKQSKRTQLQKIIRALDSVGVQYLKSEVTAQDKIEKKEVHTVVILLGAVFHKETGEYLFACPISNPVAKNHSLTDENAG